MKIINIIIFITLLVGYSSCSKDIRYNEDFEYKSVPVISSLFSPDKEFDISIKWSANPEDFEGYRQTIDSSKFETIIGANVILFENGIQIVKLSYIDSLELYRAIGFYPKVGMSYSITIDVPGYNKQLYAEASLPVPVEKLSIFPNEVHQHYYPNGYQTDEIILEGYLKVDLPNHNTPKYFMFEQNFTTIINDPDYRNNRAFYRGWTTGTLIFDDRYFINNTEVVKLEVGEFSIDREFDIKEDLYELKEKGKLRLLTLSEEAYLYLTSLARVFQPVGTSGDDIPIETYKDPKIVYSNIKNGAGIFAGYNPSTVWQEPVLDDSYLNEVNQKNELDSLLQTKWNIVSEISKSGQEYDNEIVFERVNKYDGYAYLGEIDTMYYEVMYDYSGLLLNLHVWNSSPPSLIRDFKNKFKVNIRDEEIQLQSVYGEGSSVFKLTKN